MCINQVDLLDIDLQKMSVTINKKKCDQTDAWSDDKQLLERFFHNILNNQGWGIVISGNFSINLSKSNHVSDWNILAFALILQQSFLGTLLNTPILQEKLAENINKVVGRWEFLFINQTRQY